MNGIVEYIAAALERTAARIAPHSHASNPDWAENFRIQRALTILAEELRADRPDPPDPSL